MNPLLAKSFKLEGRVYRLFDTVQVNANLIKRDLVLGVAKGPALGPEIGPELVKIEFTEYNVSLLDNLKVGDDITVHFNIFGRESNRNGQTAYFVVLNGHFVEQEGINPTAHLPERYQTIRLGSRIQSDPLPYPFPSSEPPFEK